MAKTVVVRCCFRQNYIKKPLAYLAVFFVLNIITFAFGCLKGHASVTFLPRRIFNHARFEQAILQEKIKSMLDSWNWQGIECCFVDKRKLPNEREYCPVC